MTTLLGHIIKLYYLADDNFLRENKQHIYNSVDMMRKETFCIYGYKNCENRGHCVNTEGCLEYFECIEDIIRRIEKEKRMTYICYKCGKETELCYTDDSYMEIAKKHGEQCLCRKCYIEDGHKTCPDCGEILEKEGWVCYPY